MRTYILPLMLVTLPACGESYDHDPAPKYGELGVGAFLYRCPSTGDPFCAGGAGTASSFPEAFARGARITLEYTWQDDEDHYNDPLPQLESPAASLLRSDGGRFIALVAGYAPVLAVTGNSQVVDLVHLWIREVDRVTAIDPSDAAPAPLQSLTLAEGATVELQALALDVDGVRLGGVLEQSWTSADPAVLAIVAGADAGLVHLQAVGVGATTLTLVQGARSLVLPVTVEIAADDTGDSDASSGATAGSSGTDASTGMSSSTSASSSTDATGDPGGSSGDTTGDTTTGGAL